MELDKRKQLILAAIVEAYIETGEPVGSKTVAERLDMAISSATIRNEMAVLTEIGLIEQPHTSAGRVPSHVGYHFYIDHLMHRKSLSAAERQKIDSLLQAAQAGLASLWNTASNALAYITNCASVTTTPSGRAKVFGRIELVDGGRKTVVLLFMTTTGGVRNKVCRLDFDPSPDTCVRFVRLVNDRLAETPIEEITPAFIQTLAALLGESALALSPVLFAIYAMAGELAGGEIILDGQTNLLSHRELAENAKIVLDFLGKSHQLKALVNSSGEQGLSVTIGGENDSLLLPQLGVIVAKYQAGGDILGSVGIIGPTRIDYAKMIPYIEYFAKAMGNLLSTVFVEEWEDLDG